MARRTVSSSKLKHPQHTTRRQFLITTVSVVAVFYFMAGCSQTETTSVKGQSEAKRKKVLIVTGIDYPGHKWKLTAPVLTEAIAADKRLDVTITEKPSDLASDELDDYDVIVLHFMDWEVPDPGPKARTNLKRIISSGKSLVLVHFACGAFQEWPEFVELAGRVWDPKLRGHDPHGRFAVKITEDKHPVTRGMKDFETVDELYTCLTGKTPIKVLATARSKVDGKDYPMAFVLNYSKGRVFHSVLGHDVQALVNPDVGRLFRNACAWGAGLEPLDN
ncbi:MAG: ThuA domain-containing protein [Planctomycetota bacterium]|jgi:type 1 glutamine amidotransferase